MRLRVSTDNRGGSVSVKAGKADARDDNYNLDPSRRYGKVSRTLAESAGSGGGQMTVKLETSSEFVGFVKDSYECDSLTFKSVATITLPQDAAAAAATGVVQDSISMGFRVEGACRVRLTATVLSDMDVAEVRVDGPSFAAKPVRVFDDFDDTLVIDKPGEYYLRGAYQLNVRTPNAGLGGRPIAVEMQATLTPAG